MLGSLPPGSTTIRREIITEGQAFPEDGTLLTLGSGDDAEGTASHEVTHILVHRAADGIVPRMTAWLNEGLAEYGNVKPGYSFDMALDFAVANVRLQHFTNMTNIAGTPEDAMIFYGQSRSMVRLMIGTWGPEKMRELMSTLKRGVKIEDAIKEVYGLTLVELENLWRKGLGAPPYVPAETGRAMPTPLPQSVPMLYSLTPQPRAETVGATSDGPTPSPVPEPTATPVPALAAAQPQPEATALPPGPEEKPVASGGGCNPPAPGAPPAQDLSAVGLLLGLAGLGVRRRMGRRLR
jgi:hypothetical protein